MLQRGAWRALAAGAAFVVVSGPALVGCSSDDEGGSGSDTSADIAPNTLPAVLRLGVNTSVQFDPTRAVPTEQSHMIALDLLYDGLTSIDPTTGEPAPALAGEWRVNEDFTEWTFDLRDDAAFSDGAPVDGADVRFSLERVASLGTATLAGVRLGVVKGYEAFASGDTEHIGGITVPDDGRSVHFSMTEAFAPLPELLSSPIFGVLPAAAAAEMESDDPDDPTGPFFDAPVGSGPLALAGSDADTAASAERPDGADRVVVMRPVEGALLSIDEVELVHFDEVEESFAAFRDGALDWSLVPSEQVSDAAEEFGGDAMSPFHAEFFYGINVGNEAYEDRDFREALVRAVDRAAIIEDFFPSGIPLNGTVVQGVPGFQEDPCGDPCAFDPDEARSLLEDAFGDNEPPDVKLDFFEGDSSREQDVAQAVKANLEDVGLTVELRPHDAGDYERFVTSGEQEVFLFGWVGVAPTADSYLAPLFLSGSPDNVTSFGAEAVDAAVAAARSFESGDERASAYETVEEAVMAEVPVIPLVQVRTLAVVSERVSGWQPQLDGTFVVGSVELS